jgi:hypothetical protein
MKHVRSFNGSITSALLALGLDSVKVLEAANAWRGSVKGQSPDTKCVTKLVGKVGAKSDNRYLSLTDSEKQKAKTAKGDVPAVGRLVALSDALSEVTDKFGASIPAVTLPDDIIDWLESVESFKLAPVQGCALPSVTA